MKKSILLCICCCATIILTAQNKQHTNTFYLLPQAALLNGDSHVGAQVQLSGGIAKGPWGIGLGAGVDYYRVRTAPVFIDLKYHPGVEQKYFLYTNLGYNIAWPLTSQNRLDASWWRSSPQSSFSNGVYTDFGIGYYLGKGPTKGIVLSLGYSMKTITESYMEVIAGSNPVRMGVKESNYKFNRVSVKLGYRL